jgi:hypothetical protein
MANKLTLVMERKPDGEISAVLDNYGMVATQSQMIGMAATGIEVLAQLMCDVVGLSESQFDQHTFSSTPVERPTDG